jgi:cleavage and polyadenylation specificity factor subunit 4
MTEFMNPLAAPLPQQEEEKPQPPVYNFKFSDFLRREYRFGLSPDRPTCKAYMQGHCPDGNRCPNKHNVTSSYNKYVIG